MLSLALKATDRKCVNPALEIEEQTNEPDLRLNLMMDILLLVKQHLYLEVLQHVY